MAARPARPGLFVAYPPARARLASAAPLSMHPDLGPSESATAYVGQNLIRNSQVRGPYTAEVSILDPFDYAGRDRLKERYRPLTPAPERYGIRAERGSNVSLEPKSIGGANRTNPRVTRAVGVAEKVGRGSALLSALLGGVEIASAVDKPRAAAGVAGSIGGGVPGGIAGAELGGALGAALTAPVGGVGAAPGAVVGGVLGSVGGGELGRYLLQQLYAAQTSRPDQPNRASLPR